MSTRNLLLSLFKYKAWANAGLFAELGKLDTAEQQAERQAAIRVMNHTYVVDRIFAAHLCGEQHGYAGTNTAETPELDALGAAVAASDRWYLEYIEKAPPNPCGKTFGSRSPMGRPGACRARKCWRTSSPTATIIAVPWGASCADVRDAPRATPSRSICTRPSRVAANPPEAGG